MSSPDFSTEGYGKVQKIPTIFLRERRPGDSRYVTQEVAPGCEDVLGNPEWVATRKYDGVAVRLDEDGTWWARKSVAVGKEAPEGFVEVYEEHVERARERPDNVKRYGWVPMKGSVWQTAFEDACAHSILSMARSGTYELCGPDVLDNPEGYDYHKLMEHARADRIDIPARCVGFHELRHFFLDVLGANRFEGIVWHGPGGRMAKLKVRDFRGKAAA